MSEPTREQEIGWLAVDEFFSRLSRIAEQKSDAEHGPAPADTLRSLHAVTLTMNEIVNVKFDMQREEGRDR